ncbi:MAG: DeoR/GlpR transcriptional regulator [Lachnospiraceae bacterium]|nr:DeoR/GlpR transcriptional regulator [Lachnospiraceae bacterium]
MKSIGKTERHYSLLLNALKTQRQLSTKEAASLLNVSESTARRLFGELAKSGKVIRTFGGIAYSRNNTENEDYIFSREVLQHTDIKTSIGNAAAETLHSGDIIYIDAGSTTLQFAQAVCQRIESGQLSNLIVVTNSIKHTRVFGSLCTVFTTGGEYQENSDSFVGALAEDFVSKFNYSKCFLGCDGASLSQGASSKNLDSARISQCALNRSSQTYLLMVSHKMEHPSFYCFAPTHMIDCIITDDSLNPEIKAAYARTNIRLVTVSPEAAVG